MNLKHALSAQPTSMTKAMVLDLRDVTFCSAGGITVLLELRERAALTRVPLGLVADNRCVHRALECLGLRDLFSTHIVYNSALAAVSADEGRRPR